ncbi:hypothetical protein [Microbacterium sp. NPDC056569]|uniref:hypothetical protein n=1 Tax=Microbacterium sp. NPDC056569 TaxID=3345867 RepID=UPI00366C2E06
MTDRYQHDTVSVPDENADADTASSGASGAPLTTHDDDRPVDNPLWRMTMPKPYIWTALLGVAAAAAAFVIGTKAGGSRFRELSGIAKDVWNDPAVAKVRDRAFHRIESTATRVASRS